VQSPAVYLFGSPRIVKDGSQVEVDTRKAVALLAYLAVTDFPHNRESLSTLLYPDLDTTHARAALRRTISSLKKAIGSSCLVVSGESLSLGDLWIDIREFSKILLYWKTHKHPEGVPCPDCFTRLEEAARLYNGDFLAGFTLRDSISFDDWQYYQTESFKKVLSEIFGTLVPWLYSSASYERAIAYARRWLSLDNLNEEAHRELMRCYAWSGQHGAALRQYRECVKTLERELGVSPVEETTQLYRAIMENRLPESTQNLGGVDLSMSREMPGKIERAMPREGESPIIGRSQELDEIRWAYQWSATRGVFFLIEGEMGIGKSRLAQDFLSSIDQQNKSTLVARCFEGESELAYAPFIEALQSIYSKPGIAERVNNLPEPYLSQAALLIPEIEMVLVRKSDGQGMPVQSQANFFESLRRIILTLIGGNPPVVLFIDDLQWADAASLDFLAYLVRRLDIQPLFILCTWRYEGSSIDQRIQKIFSDAQRYGTGKIIHLGRLSEEVIQQLVVIVLRNSGDFPGDFSHRLYQETEGVPFLAVEYLNKVIADAQNVGFSRESIDDWVLPDNVRDALQARFTNISDIGWQLLTTGAVLGRSFDHKNLMDASGRTEAETVLGLEELLKRRIIKERVMSGLPGGIEYDFSHEKIRQLVYEQTSLSRRRLMHRRVAEVLMEQARVNRAVNINASTIAQHFQLAGELAQAAEYYRLAGENSRSLFAHREAVANFHAALTYGHPKESELYEAIGDSLAMLGDYHAASESYEAAIAFCQPQEMMRFELKLGNIHHRLGEYELAMCYFQASASGLKVDDDPSLLARVYADWSRSAFFLHDPDKAGQLASQALIQAEKAGDPWAIAQVHNTLGILARHADQFDTAQEHLTKSLQVANQLEEPVLILAAHNNLALLNVRQGDLVEAIKNNELALEHCMRVGDRHLEAALHNNLADIYHAMGESDQAMQELKKAVVIFAEIGVQEGEIVPEVWKLTEW